MPRLLRKPWHDALIDCVAKHTETPDRFIQWSAISVISGVMKRKFFLKDGLYTIYPNQYIVLVAPPGIGKGTAIKFLWDMIKENSPFLANFIPDRATAPKILERLANGWNTAPVMIGQQIVTGTKEHTCTILSTELSVLLGASEQMLDYLCEFWDKGEFEYDTKNSGSSFVKEMAVSLMGATVPDFIRNIDRDRSMSIKGGFTSRCLFIYEDKPARYLPDPPPLETNPVSAKLLQDIKTDLKWIASLPGGEFQWATDAKISFIRFLGNLRNTASIDDEATINFKSRIRAHVLKLAMVLAISRHDTLTIERIDMENSIAYVNGCLQTLEKIFRGSGESDLAVSTAYVKDYVERVGAASRKEMLKHLHRHMSHETLDRIIYTLTEIGYWKVTAQPGGGAMFQYLKNGHSSNGAGGKKVP